MRTVVDLVIHVEDEAVVVLVAAELVIWYGAHRRCDN